MRNRTTVVLATLAALAALVAAVLVTTTLLTGTGQDGATSAAPGASPPTDSSSAAPTTAPLRTYTAAEAGRVFLDTYVEDDGRVVRRDQDGDTVSEGQAYAMLIAVGLHDAATFESVWSWTRAELQRRDGLLSWRWADGEVLDPSSASDADLDAARALVLAGQRFEEPRYSAAGVELGSAVLDLETVRTDAGRILTAGQWADTEPHAYNPSYASPAATAVLAQAFPDPRWGELDAGSRAVTAALLREAPLPPDWAQVHADGRVEAMPGAQGRGQSVRYGYDAARTALRFAESCDPADRELAAALAGPLDRADDAAELDLGGSPLVEGRSALAASAHAAAVAAAGQADRAVEELVHADHLAQARPTYYGAAWAALGRLMLTGDALGGCPPVPAAS